ncbi:hypothetical protein [uncultured Gilliamella sp.]|uniref:hypothetical protein n=1 Tax=uncultured Gilliamella sp. TaxID=1193505 RepID=UPI00260134EA|nr:hypothetical protein [uncultured Gilliamella sp.]
MKLTEHFTLEEFTHSTTASRLKINNCVPTDLMSNIQLGYSRINKIISKLAL